MTVKPVLSREEKAAGRAFRELAQAMAEKRADSLLAAASEEGRPFSVVPNFLAQFRHECARRGGRSTAMDLKEIYSYSPAFYVWREGGQWVMADSPPDGEVPGPFVIVPAGRFGFITKEGKCSCGALAASRAGRLVDAYERAPIEGRVAR